MHLNILKNKLTQYLHNANLKKHQIFLTLQQRNFEKLNYQMSEIFDDIEYYDENDADISYSAEDMIKKLSGSN